MHNQTRKSLSPSERRKIRKKRPKQHGILLKNTQKHTNVSRKRPKTNKTQNNKR